MFCVNSSAVWDMFHLVRLNTALAVMISAILQWISETQSIRDDRNMNELFSMLKQVGSRNFQRTHKKKLN